MKFETFLFFLVSSLAIMFLLWGLKAEPLVMVPVVLASMFSGRVTGLSTLTLPRSTNIGNYF